MEKNKLIKVLKLLVAVIYIFIFCAVLFYEFIFKSRFSPPTSFVIYWMIFIGWVAIVLNFRLVGRKSLKFAFYLFLISASTYVFGLESFSESIMRISLLGWIIGITQTLLESKFNEKS